MASEKSKPLDSVKHCEEKIAGLHLLEKGEVIALAAHDDCSGGTKKVTRIDAGDAQGRLVERTSPVLHKAFKDGEKTWKQSIPVGLKVVKEEIPKSADEEAYIVRTVDHHFVTELKQELEINVEVPSSLADGSADSEGKEQQGKNTIQSIAGRIVQSVKNVFSDMIGRSKAAKVPDAKCDDPPI